MLPSNWKPSIPSDSCVTTTLEHSKEREVAHGVRNRGLEKATSAPLSMMSSEAFTLPKEFEGFVSNSDSLLKQFERLDVEDAVTLSLYPDPGQKGNALSLSELQSLLDSVTAAIDDLSKQYIWFKDSLTLHLIVPNDKNSPPHFTGTVNFLDSIADEWFITYIAFKLSESYRNMSICCTDTDGQFLLIEAADFIPDWIDPENCENRLWIRTGLLHIVALDEPGRNSHDSGIKLSSALQIIRNRPEDTIANRQVQAAIEQRTTLYPVKAIAETHIAHCTLARTVAEIFQASPKLISTAINAFCLPQAAGSNKNYIAVMQKFGSGLTDLVTVPIRFTRLQYAKIMYQTFHIPKKFHTAMRIVGQADSIILNKSFDLGCRLMCGIESAYQRSKNDINHILQYEAEERKKLKSQKIEKYFSTNYINNPNVSNVIDNIILTSKNTNEGEISDQNNSENNVNENKNENKNEILDEIKISKKLLNDLKLSEKNVPQDSDSWLFLSPEEMDREMEMRVKSVKMKLDNSENKSAEKHNYEGKNGKSNEKKEKDERGIKLKNKETDSEADQLQVMLKGMKLFLGGKSGIDGIEGDSKRDSKAVSNSSNSTLKSDMKAKSSASLLATPTATPIVNHTKNDTENDTKSDTKNVRDNSDNSNNGDNGLEIDFSKLMRLLKTSKPKEHSSETIAKEHSSENTEGKEHSLKNNEGKRKEGIEKKEGPLGTAKSVTENAVGDVPLSDYFYDEDIDEFESESEADSDDEGEDEGDEGGNDSGIVNNRNGNNHNDGVDIHKNNDKNDNNNYHNNNSKNDSNDSNNDNNNSNRNDRKPHFSPSISGVKLVKFSNNKTDSENTDLITNVKKLSISKNIQESGWRCRGGAEPGIGDEADSDDEIEGASNVRTVRAVSTDMKGGFIGDSFIAGDSDITGGNYNNSEDKDDEDGDDDDDSFYDSSDTDSDDEIEEENTYRNTNRNAYKGGNKASNKGKDMEGNKGDKDDDDNNGGSDDEDDNEEDEDEKRFLLEYGLSMDRELASSTLIESFERYSAEGGNNSHNREGGKNRDGGNDRDGERYCRDGGNDRDDRGGGDGGNEGEGEAKGGHEAVDVDLNFLKYLLESHASQLGSAGPATQLFSQLGIKLPSLPPMNTRGGDA